MARRELDDAELWLPPDFALDDDAFSLKGARRQKLTAGARAEAPSITRDCFSDAFPFGFAWNPDLPHLEPLNGESDDELKKEEEEDYMAGLTRRMAHSFLQDDDDNPQLLPWGDSKVPRAVAGSPQSTLCGWPASKKGSPNSPSLVSSPPLSPVEQHGQQQQRAQDEEWDLLSRAAGEVERLLMIDLERRRNLVDCGLVDPPKKTSPAVPVLAPPCKGSGTGYFPGPVAIHHQQLQAAHFYRLKQLQLMKQQLSAAWGSQSKASSAGVGRRSQGLSPSAWPLLQKSQAPQPGNGMRAVFLNGAKKVSNGTGVFLPRTPGSKTEPRKKPACSTVLVPARVVQALNLNLEDLGAPPRFPDGFAINHDALLDRTKAILSQQKRNHLRPHPPAPEIQLPQEWTY